MRLKRLLSVAAAAVFFFSISKALVPHADRTVLPQPSRRSDGCR